MTKFVKGLIMTLIGVIVAALNTTPVVWSVVIVTLIGTALVYTGKNAWFQSNSQQGKLELRDIFSALLIAAGTSVVSAVASIAGTGAIDWMLLLKTVSGVILSYLGTTVFTGNPVKK
jgi:hypothetical protein